MLALKKSSNNELFEHIKNTLDEELNDREFKLMNIENNFARDGHPIPHITVAPLQLLTRINPYKMIYNETLLFILCDSMVFLTLSILGAFTCFNSH